MLEKFPKSPITEALIDVRVELPPDINPMAIEALHELFKNDYPNQKTRRRFEGKIEIPGDVGLSSTTQDLKIDGYLFLSSDGKQVVQFRLDGFTFSRLRPYQEWEKMFPEAMRLWKIYSENLKPNSITRLAVRYINLIEIPEESFSLEEYFVAPPTIPENLPQTLEQFLTQVTIDFREQKCKAIITQTIGPTKNPKMTPIILDLDIFRFARLTPNDPAVEQILIDLHNVVELVFDKHLKDKAKALFR